MILEAERRNAELTVTDAFLLAQEGRKWTGFMLLSHSIQHAKSHAEPWSVELVDLLCLAQERFTESFPAEWYSDFLDH